jgi:hypothetical protein
VSPKLALALLLLVSGEERSLDLNPNSHPRIPCRVPDLAVENQPLLRAFVFRRGVVCCVAAFDREAIVIGRGIEADLVLDCDVVSRRHALVRIVGDKLTIEDLHSRNGVWLGTRRVACTALKAWQPVSIGTYVIRFHLAREPMSRGIDPEATDETLDLTTDDERTIEEAALASAEPSSGAIFPMAELLEPEPRTGPQGPGAGRTDYRQVTTLVTRAPELRRTSGVHHVKRPFDPDRDPSAN